MALYQIRVTRPHRPSLFLLAKANPGLEHSLISQRCADAIDETQRKVENGGFYDTVGAFYETSASVQLRWTLLVKAKTSRNIFYVIEDIEQADVLLGSTALAHSGADELDIFLIDETPRAGISFS